MSEITQRYYGDNAMPEADDMRPELGDTVIFSARGKYSDLEAEEGVVTQLLKKFIRVRCGDHSYLVERGCAIVLRRAG